ncbi:MAG: flagellar motor switch protein FliN [Treponema sp.]|nr:flagellar motor switch protein FliN [Candidatus Treponema caballi]
MSDGAISQEEIDALLSGVDMGGIGSSGISSPKSSDAALDTSTMESTLSDMSSKLKECLDSMTGSSFEVDSPTIESTDRDGVLKQIPEMVISVISDYNAGVNGEHQFILAPEFASKLTSLINKEETPELDEMALSVVSECISTFNGSEITQISSGGKLTTLASNPAEATNVPKAMVRFPQGNFVLATYPVRVDGGAFSLYEIFSADVSNGISQALGGGSPMGGAAPSTGLSAEEMQSMTAMTGMGGGASMGGAMGGMGMNMGGMGMPQMQPMGGAMGGMGMGMPQGGGMGMGMDMGMGGGMPQNIPNVQSLQYPTLQTGMNRMEQQNIGLIMDVYMEMTVELGRTKKLIKDILGMGEGTIIELDKLAGEPVDILVNQKPIARGEVVVIDENFGVRVTEILSPMERVSDLH